MDRLTIDNVKPGTIIIDNTTSRKFLIVGLNSNKKSIDCLDQDFGRISLGIDWIHEYLIYDTVVMDKMVEWLGSYT